MRASRTPTCRLLDYSAPLQFDGAEALRRQIVAYAQGVRGARLSGVTEAEIVAWFRGTPSAFVRARLTEVVAQDRVRVCMANLSSGRRSNGAYRYEAPQ